MTYLTLLLVCLLPPIVLLSVRARTNNSFPHVPGRYQAAALVLLTVLAVTATLPWDAALIARGAWSYPRGRPIGWVAGVPVEELLFMIVQPVLIGLWLRGLPSLRSSAPRPLQGWRVCIAGSGLLLGLSGAGLLVAGTPRGTYLGSLLAWAGPVLALQWLAAGDVLWLQRHQLAAAVLPPTVYLCAVDRLALHLHLWKLSNTHTTGLKPLGLPVEEAAFFLLTTALVVSGLVLATDRTTVQRLRHVLNWHKIACSRVGPAAQPGWGRTRTTTAKRGDRT